MCKSSLEIKMTDVFIYHLMFNIPQSSEFLEYEHTSIIYHTKMTTVHEEIYLKEYILNHGFYLVPSMHLS